MGSIIVALMISGWFEMSLIARAEVLKVKELEYIRAARTMGAGHLHITFRDIVPNIVGKLVTRIMLSIPQAVFLEAFLSFVGLGHHDPSYGRLSPCCRRYQKGNGINLT